jgi:hypothetical protein
MDTQAFDKKHADLIEDATKIWELANERRGEHPRIWKPREDMIQEFEETRMNRSREKEAAAVEQGTEGARQSDAKQPEMNPFFLGPAYVPCITPLAQLKPVMLKKLRLQTHNRGTYVLLRAIREPYISAGITLLVEDEREHVTGLTLYQQEEPDASGNCDIVDTNTVLLVKEPFLTVLGALGDHKSGLRVNEYGLRVDHLSDVILLDEYHPMIPKAWRPQDGNSQLTPESLRAEGNSAFYDGNFSRAVRL